MSSNIKVGEVGRRIYFNTSFDLSGATSVSATLTKPSGATLIVSPVVQSTAFNGFAAYEYATYDTQAGDVNEQGIWTAIVTYNDATPKIYISDSAQFTVDAAI